MQMLREFFYDLLPNYLERIVLGIGYVWGLAFDSVHLAMQWFLVLMLSDYLSGVYQALRLGEYDSKKGANSAVDCPVPDRDDRTDR